MNADTAKESSWKKHFLRGKRTLTVWRSESLVKSEEENLEIFASSRGDCSYIRLRKELFRTLSPETRGDIFVSLEYVDKIIRTGSAEVETIIPSEEVFDEQRFCLPELAESFIRELDERGTQELPRVDSTEDSPSHQQPSIPARTSDGSALWLSFRSSHLKTLPPLERSIFWRKIFLSSTGVRASIQSDAETASGGPSLSLWIRPGRECETIAPGTSTGFDFVAQAARDIAKDEDVSDKLLFDKDIPVEEWGKYTFLSENPFRLYETWVHVEELSKYLEANRDEPFPRLEDALKVEKLVQQRFAKSSSIGEARMIENGDTKKHTLKPRQTTNFVTGDKILDALSKQKGEKSSSGGLPSPDEVARQLGWEAGEAEWLAPLSDSWRGLCEFDDDILHGAGLRNRILGTQESQRVLLRYQNAWKSLFTEEKTLLDLKDLELDTEPNSKPVLGILSVNLGGDGNDDILQSTPENTDNCFRRSSLASHVELKEVMKVLPFISPTIRFSINMAQHSQILRRYKPNYVIDIYPFMKLPTTQFEERLDARLLEILFTAALDKEITGNITNGSGINAYIALLLGLESPDSELEHIEASLPESTLSHLSPSNLIEDGVERALDASKVEYLGNSIAENTTQVVEKTVDAAIAPVNKLKVPSIINEQNGTTVGPASVSPSLQRRGFRRTVASKTKHAIEAAPAAIVSVAHHTVQPIRHPRRTFKKVISKLQGHASDAVLREALKGVTFEKEGFKHQEDFYLFDAIPARLYSYKQTPTAEQPVLDVVVLGGSAFKIGSIFPSLEKTIFDHALIADPRFLYAAMPTADGLPAGMSFEAMLDLEVFSPSLALTAKDLSTRSGVGTTVRIFAFLGPARDWKSMLAGGSFTFIASLNHKSLKIGEVLEFLDLRMEMSLYELRGVDVGVQWLPEFSFSGNVGLAVPGSLTPLKLSCLLRKTDDGIQLYLTNWDEEWKDALGIKGLTISSITVSALIDNLTDNTQLSLDMRAVIKLAKGELFVTGLYSKEDYYLSARLGDVTLQDLADIFNSMTGYHIEPLAHEIRFEDILLRISKDGLTFHGKATINGYTSLAASVVLTPDGLEISGSLSNAKFTGFEINLARFSVFIGRLKEEKHLTSRSTTIAIEGKATIHDILDLDCVLLFEKKQGEDLSWVAFSEIKGEISTSRFVPELKGTFLDVTVTKVAFIASNRTRPSLDMQFGYSVLRGVHICGTLKEGVPALNHIFRAKEDIKGLVLRAGRTALGFEIGITLPPELSITMGERVTVGPFEVGFEISGRGPIIAFRAPLRAKAASQKEPLEFVFGLRAGMLEGEGFGHMTTTWTNPLNISSRLSISNVAVQLSIIYKTFIVSGIPGSVGLSGKLALGSKSADVAIKVSQDPTQELIYARVQDLGLADLVMFAAGILGESWDVPTQEQELLRMVDCELYLSRGTRVGITEYPRGASFKGIMSIFGKKASLECTISQGILIRGSIQGFQLGPLTVASSTPESPDPTISIEISESKQSIHLTGKVSLFGLSHALNLRSSLYPLPQLTFTLAFSFSGLLKFDMRATLIGPSNLKTLSSLQTADFELYAKLEQNIVDYVAKLIQEQLFSTATMVEEAEKGHVKDGCKEKQASLLESLQKLQGDLTAASTLLQTLKSRREARRAQLLSLLTTIRASRAARIERRQQALATARANLTEILGDVEREIVLARTKAAAGLAAIQVRIAERRREREKMIGELRGRIQRRKLKFYREYGVGVKVDEEGNVMLEGKVGEEVEAQDEGDENGCSSGCGLPCFKKKAPPISTARASAPDRNPPPLPAEVINEKLTTATLKSDLSTLTTTQSNVLQTLLTEKQTLETITNSQITALEQKLSTLSSSGSPANQTVKTAEEALKEAEKEGLEAIKNAEKEIKEFEKKGEEVIEVNKLERKLSILRESMREVEFASSILSILLNTASSTLATLSTLTSWIGDGKANLFNIKSIELSGRLRGIVEGKKGLRAVVRGTVWDEEVEWELSWEPGDRVKFLRDVFEGVWRVVRGKLTGGGNVGRGASGGAV